MAEEKSPDDDDMTPDERVSWLRDRVSFNVLLLICLCLSYSISKDDDSHYTNYYIFHVDRASKWKHRKSDA
jgi:hypothetical protein